jgi:hypothetical protein
MIPALVPVAATVASAFLRAGFVTEVGTVLSPVGFIYVDNIRRELRLRTVPVPISRVVDPFRITLIRFRIQLFL